MVGKAFIFRAGAVGISEAVPIASAVGAVGVEGERAANERCKAVATVSRGPVVVALFVEVEAIERSGDGSTCRYYAHRVSGFATFRVLYAHHIVTTFLGSELVCHDVIRHSVERQFIHYRVFGAYPLHGVGGVAAVHDSFDGYRLAERLGDAFFCRYHQRLLHGRYDVVRGVGSHGSGAQCHQ